MTRTTLRFSTRFSTPFSTRGLLILLLASSVPGCTFLSGIEDTKRDKDSARTFDDPVHGGSGGSGGGGSAGAVTSIDISGGSDSGTGGTDAGTAGSDTGGAAGTGSAGEKGGSS